MVTIVVLLILAGVSISMLTGENGILKKANQTEDIYGIGQAEEYLKLAKTELILDCEQA